MEKLQNKALIRTLSKPSDTPITELNNESGVTSIKERIELLAKS